MLKDLPLMPDKKWMCNLETLYAKIYQFLINFIREKRSQFGIIDPKTAHEVILILPEIYPSLSV